MSTGAGIVGGLMVTPFKRRWEAGAKAKSSTDKKDVLEDLTEYPLTFMRTLKDVKITDNDGNAVVHFFQECRNSSDKEIPRIVHELHHDGKLNNFVVRVNEKSGDISQERYIERKETNGETIGPLARKLKFTINLEKIALSPGQTMRYDYRVDYAEVFKKMFEPNVEYTSYHVMMPTSSLKIIVAAHEGLQFNERNCYVIVKGFYEIEDFREEDRCKQEFPIVYLHDGNIMLCEILKPKIACTYYVYFQVMK
jgi:hypothetical protein